MDFLGSVISRCGTSARRCLGLKIYVPPGDQEDRYVWANDPAANADFCDNHVITYRYTWYNFLPLFLLEQFTRFANAYFLMISIMQLIPAITITNGLPTNLLPLSIVLAFDGVITAREDYNRHVDDTKANTSKVLVMTSGSFVDTMWKDVRVGDIIKVLRNNPVPADCVFLASYSSDLDTPDSCYVQTAQLDGETSLKLRQAIPATVQRFKSDADCAAFRGCVRCEPPTSAFEKFVGQISMSPPRPGGTGVGVSSDLPLPLEAAQTLLRGSIIRNVDYVYALVVYTGRETKVRVRQQTVVQKRAQVEKQMNGFIVLLVIMLALFCLAGGLISSLLRAANWRQLPYLGVNWGPGTVIDGVNSTFTYVLLTSSFIPVSLYVTVRMARTCQMFFMMRDTEMYHVEPEVYKATGGLEGEFPFRVRSMDLNDELGQITHVFSDKTGTLTLNYMEFRKLIVGGVSFGLGTTMIGIERMRREGADPTLLAALAHEEKGRKAVSSLPHVNFTDGSDSHPGRSMAGDLRSLCDGPGTPGDLAHQMLIHLVVNHSVLTETVRDNAGALIGSRLSASSPDEEAFLYAAESFGYKFIGRTHESITIRISRPLSQLPFRRISSVAPAGVLSGGSSVDDGAATLVSFRILHILAYTQERKRMSVIVEHPVVDAAGRLVYVGQGPVMLYCKGADSAILARTLAPSTAAEGQRNALSKQMLSQWGNDGLRTLVFGCRFLERADFDVWNARYVAACADIEEVRKMKNQQPNYIDELMESIETSLQLQGATANEDKLQPGVPETIAQLARAGIRVWMVTGDKQETAVNIGFATKLLDDSMRQVVVTVDSAGSVAAAMKRLRIAAKRMAAERDAFSRSESSNRGGLRAFIAWLDDRVTATEKALGFSVPEQSEASQTLSDAKRQEGSTAASALAKDSSKSPPSPRLVLPRPGGPVKGNTPVGSPELDSMRVALNGASAAPATTNTSRLRSDSFNSDDGEEHDTTTALDKPAAAVPAEDSSARSGGVGSINLQLQPNSNSGAAGLSAATAQLAAPAGEPTDMAALLAPLLGSQALDVALKHPSTRGYLLFVAVNSAAVVCCRARPDQKARVVDLIRRGVPSSRTLAIGDGANDVNMIRTAHVGVGIAGVEGVQAANASDFSIGRFRFLQRLLLVHGRWNYHRMARLVLYSFSKNIIFVACQFWYSYLTLWSGQKYYVEYGSQTYNLIYTSLPVLIMGIYDRDLDAETVLRHPTLYDFTRSGSSLSLRVFLSVIFGALVETLAVFFVCINGYYMPAVEPVQSAFVFQQGTVTLTAVIAVVSLRIAAETHSHYWFFSGIVLLSCILWIPACYIFDALNQNYLSGGMRFVFGSLEMYLTVLLCMGISGARLLAWKGYKRLFCPELRHLVQETVRFGLDESKLDEYSAVADVARRTGKSIPEVFDALNHLDSSSKQKNPFRLAATSGAEAPPAHVSVGPLSGPGSLQARVAGRLTSAMPPADGTPYDAANDFDHDASPRFKGVPRGDLELVSVPSKQLLVPPRAGPLPSHGILPAATSSHHGPERPVSAFPDGIRRTADDYAGHSKPSSHGSAVSIDPAAAAYVSGLYSSHGGASQPQAAAGAGGAAAPPT